MYTQSALTALTELPSPNLASFLSLDPVLLPETLHHAQESRGTRRPELCRFPFKWKGKEHHSCTTIGDPEHKPWCPVSLDRHGNAEQQRWGHCNPRLCSAQIELDMLDSAKMMSHLDSASNKSNSRGSATKSKSRGSATSAESTISNLTGSESSSLDSRSRVCQTVSHIETDEEIQSLICLNFFNLGGSTFGIKPSPQPTLRFSVHLQGEGLPGMHS